MPTKRTTLLPLVLAGIALGASAMSPPPQKGAGVKLPASYADFYPSLRNQTAEPVTIGQPSFRNTSARLSASSDIYGYLYYFQGTQIERGFYRINSNPAATFLWADSYTTEWSMGMTGGWIRNGKLCGLNSLVYMGGLLAYGQIELDIHSGEVTDYQLLTVDANNANNQYITTAYRDLDDRVYGYGYIYSGTSYGFKSAQASDIDTSEPVCEVEFENVCTSLCYNVQDDAFYGVTTKGDFVSITPQGEQTVIMPLDIRNMSSTVTGLTYSPKDGVYILNAYLKDGNSAIYAIDADARTCTKLYDCQYGEEFIFFVCTADNASDEAPARPGFESADFPGASLDGTLSFTMPGRTVADNPLSGNLDWRIYVDGVQVKTGSVPAGSKVAVELSGLSNEEHTFAFCAGKDGNWSMPVTTRKWIGSDFPSAPADIVLTEEKVTWNAVTTSVHDGYVDYASIKYIVTLNGKEMGETDGMECAITLPDGTPFDSYTAEVTAVADGKMSAPGESNYITYGEPLCIPGESSLHYRPEEYELKLFEAIDIDGKLDSEGNPRNWHYSETMGFPSFASGADGEDLLIFPPIMFDRTDRSYKFQMEAGLIHDSDNTGTIEVLIGKEPNPESMTRTVIPSTRLYHMRPEVMAEYFSVPEPGAYYLGVLTRTNNVAFHISDMDISLSDRAADVPMAVTDLEVSAGGNGALMATVSLTLPTHTVAGKEIPADTELTATVISRDFVINKPSEGELIDSSTVTGKPGERVTTTVKTQQNYNTIAAICSVDNRTSSETTTYVYTGLVRPYKVENLKAEISEDNMSIRLTWTPPIEGEDPGVIGDSFYYSLWYYADGWQFYEGAGWDVAEAVIELAPDNPQTILMVGVMAMNDAGQSDHISAVSTVVGLPYELPIAESLRDGEETFSPIAIQRPDVSYNDTQWMVTDPAEVSALFSNTSGWAYIGYIGTSGVESGNSRLSLPKFSTVGCSDVKISLTYWGGPYAASFTLLSNVYGSEEPETVGSFPAGQGWITNSLSLPETLNGLKWVELLLDSKFESSNSYAMFSGYTISGVSAVEGIGTDGEGRIFTTPGMLHVAGFAGERLSVLDMAGRVFISVSELDDIAGYALAPGLYVVKAGGIAKTVVVK